MSSQYKQICGKNVLRMTPIRAGWSLSPRVWILNAILYGLVLLLVASDVSARPPYFLEWQSTYPNSTTDDMAGRDGCQVCHGSVSSQWNAYGNSVAALVRGGTAIGDAIAQVELLDADGQGDSNLIEIIANSQPGWTFGANNPIFDDNNNQSGTLEPMSIGVQLPFDPPIPADILIKSVGNVLHPHHNGDGSTPVSTLLDDVIRVVVFGQSTGVGDPTNLDTDLIDLETLRFGPGFGGIAVNENQQFNQDVDSDGLDDLRSRFLMSDAAFACNDSAGTLTGELTSGQTFQGSDTFDSDCDASCH